MPGFLDTSVVVRYITADPPVMAERSRQLIDTETELHVTDAVLAETSYVLRTVYRLTREEVVDAMIAFLQRQNIVVHSIDKRMAIAALLLCRPSGRVSVSDALLWAAARSAGPSAVYSFDRRFPAEGIELRQP